MPDMTSSQPTSDAKTIGNWLQDDAGFGKCVDTCFAKSHTPCMINITAGRTTAVQGTHDDMTATAVSLDCPPEALKCLVSTCGLDLRSTFGSK